MGQFYNLARVKRSLVYFLIGRSFMTAASALFSLLVVWYLSIQDYGEYVALSGLIGVIALISSGGMGRILPRFLPELREQGDTLALRSLCWRLFLFRMLIVLIVSIPLTLLGRMVFEMLSVNFEMALIIPFFLNIIFSEAAAHLVRSLQVLLFQRESAIGISIEWMCKLLILCAWILWSGTLGIVTVFWIQFAGYVIAVMFLVFRLMKCLNRLTTEHVSIDSDGIESNRLWKFGLNNYVQQMLGTLFSPHLNKVMSASLIGSVETAFLGFAFMIQNIIKKILPAGMLIHAIEPAFMARYSKSGDFRELNNMATLMLRLNLFVLFPVIAWLISSGWPLLDFISKGKYGDAVWITGALLFVVISENHRAVLQVLCNAIEQNHLLVSSNLRASLLICVQLLLIVWLGMPGLLAGLVLISWFRNYYLATRLRNLGYDYKQDWKKLFKMALFAVAAGSTGWLASFWITGITASILSGIGTAALFLLVCNQWKVFGPEERALINRGLGRRLFVW